MICLNWFSISFKLLAVVISYYGLAIICCGWFYEEESIKTFILQLATTGITLIFIRWLAKSWWRRQPVEQFMRVYG